MGEGAIVPCSFPCHSCCHHHCCFCCCRCCHCATTDATLVLLLMLSLCVCARSNSLVFWHLWGDGERWWDGVDKVVVVLGPCTCKHKVGEVVVDQNLKPSHCGLVLGLSCQTAMLGGGRWWWCVSFDVAAVTDICVRKHKQREGVDAENTKRSAMPNNNGVQWWWWWWWCVKVFVVTGIVFTNMSGEVGLGPKTPTEPLGSVLGCACIPSAKRGCCIHTATPPGVK